jgi:hypothetical protein
LIDEFEFISESPKLDRNFFSALRSLLATENFAVVTASVTPLIDLLDGREHLALSPMWDVITPVHLPLLSPQACAECLTNHMRDTGFEFTQEELTTATTMSGGHPYLLQLAGEALQQAYLQDISDCRERIEFAEEQIMPAVDQLFRLYWERSNDEHKIALATVALRAVQGKETVMPGSPEVQALYAGGEQIYPELARRSLLQRRDAGRYRLLCPLLGTWVVNELTAATRETASYEDWLQTAGTGRNLLRTSVKKQFAAILPGIAANYRELIIKWASDPRHAVAALKLLTSVFGQAR